MPTDPIPPAVLTMADLDRIEAAARVATCEDWRTIEAVRTALGIGRDGLDVRVVLALVDSARRRIRAKRGTRAEMNRRISEGLRLAWARKREKATAAD